MEFHVIWDFLSQKENRETIAWLAGAAMSCLGAVAAFRTWLKGKGRNKEPKGSGTHIQTHSGDVKIDNSHRVVSTGPSVWWFVVFALFAAFALVQAGQGNQRSASVNARCGHDMQLSTNSVVAAVALNKRGIYHAREEDFSKALDCFNAALSYAPDLRAALANVAKLHMRWDRGDLNKGLEVTERMVRVEKQKMIAFQNAPTRPGLPKSCSARAKITDEVFQIEPWLLRTHFFFALDQLPDAIQTLTDAIDVYPTKSCAYRVSLADLLLERAMNHCLLGAFAEAKADYRRARTSGKPGTRTATDFQTFWAKQGFYDGPIDGQLGSRSDRAFDAWVSAGCPGLAENTKRYIQSEYANLGKLLK